MEISVTNASEILICFYLHKQEAKYIEHINHNTHPNVMYYCAL